MTTVTSNVISSSLSVGEFNPRGVLTSRSKSIDKSPSPHPLLQIESRSIN